MDFIFTSIKRIITNYCYRTFFVFSITSSAEDESSSAMAMAVTRKICLKESRVPA
jgi:hypothetical protein